MVSSFSDKATFNSYLSFRQYNPETDVACEIQYAQTLSLDKKDKSVIVKCPENVFVDSEWSKKGPLKPGFVPGSRKYFSKMAVQEYDIASLSIEDSIRYVPIKYITNTTLIVNFVNYKLGYYNAISLKMWCVERS